MAPKSTTTGKATSAKAASAPAPASPPPSGPRVFSFAVTKGVAIPEGSTPRSALPSLPFIDAFEGMEHADAIFIPDALWTTPISEGGRGVDPEKATPGYIRNRIRTAFNGWRDKDTKARENRAIVLWPREAGDTDDAGNTYPEPGFSVFMKITPT